MPNGAALTVRLTVVGDSLIWLYRHAAPVGSCCSCKARILAMRNTKSRIRENRDAMDRSRRC